MNKIFSSVTNFFNEDNKFDYQKTKIIVEKNLEFGQNKFYVGDNTLDSFHLSYRDKKDYFENIIKIMPEVSEVLVELDYNFLNNHQEIIEEFNNYQKDFELVVKIPAVRENKIDSYCEDYLSYLNFLKERFNNNFYISFNTKFLNSINNKKLIEKSTGINSLKGFVVRSTYAYDLDFKEFTTLKEKFSDSFRFLAAADDFYLLNLSQKVVTISKYLNLLPGFFKKMKLEFKNNNLEKAKEYQLVLNEFITKVKNHGGETAFKYLLTKFYNLEFKPKKVLTKADKAVLDSEFEKINEYFVDKV